MWNFKPPQFHKQENGGRANKTVVSGFTGARSSSTSHATARDTAHGRPCGKPQRAASNGAAVKATNTTSSGAGRTSQHSRPMGIRSAGALPSRPTEKSLQNRPNPNATATPGGWGQTRSLAIAPSAGYGAGSSAGGTASVGEGGRGQQATGATPGADTPGPLRGALRKRPGESIYKQPGQQSSRLVHPPRLVCTLIHIASLTECILCINKCIKVVALLYSSAEFQRLLRGCVFTTD